jgi:hypothetical protein
MNIYTPTVAYLYKWTELTTNRWYIGSRTKQGCHPNDGYICSSRTVKPLILEHTEQWIRTILCLGTPEYIVDLETRLLTAVDAKNDPLSYNQHNGDGKFTRIGMPSGHRGKKLGPQSAEAKMKRSIALKGKNLGKVPWNKGKTGGTAWNKGIAQTDEQKAKNSLAHKNQVPWNKDKKHTAEHVANNSAAQKGINKGVAKPIVICRIDDRKEMTIQNFTIWNNKQNKSTN